MIGHAKSTWGILEENILQDAAVQNCLMAKPDFMINVALNNDKEIVKIFAGDVITAHREGCQFVKEHAMIKVDTLFDIVVTSNSGYPLDQNLYQTVKGMSAASNIVRQDGIIIAASECSDGVPDHGNYGKILAMRNTPQELLEMISDPSFRLFDQWQVQKQASIQVKARCYLFSRLDDDTVKKAMLIPVKNLEQAINELLQKNPGSKIAVLPMGPLTIPYI